MVALDMKTVMLANIIIGFIGMVVMFMLWYQNHDKYSGIAYWVLDWILLTGGMALISLQGNIPPWESMILSNSMIVGGMAILYFGLRSFAGKKSSPLLISSVLVGFAAFVIIHTYFTVVDVNLTARSLNTAGGLLLGCLIGMWLMFKEVSPQIRRISTGTGIAFGVIALICVARILGFSLLPQAGSQFLTSGKFDTTMVMLLMGAIVFLVFNLVLMVTRRLYIETEEMGDIVSRNAMELQTVFRTTSVGFGIMVNRIFTEVNEAYCRIIGYSRDELIGQDVRMVYPTEQEYQAVGQLYPKVSEIGAVTTEIRLIRKDRVIINAILNIAAFDKNDLNKGIIFSVTDITDRKKLEEKSNYLATFPELNPYPVLELDAQGNLKYQNPATKIIFPDIAVLGPRHPFLANWAQVVKDLTDADRSNTVIREIQVGHEYYEQMISPLTNNQIRIYARKITKRKEAEEALRQSEQKYRMIVENTLDIIFTTNQREEYIYVSPSVNNILGYSPAELIGKPFIDFVHPEDIPILKNEINNTYSAGYKFSSEIEYRLRHASGEWRWVISSGTRVVDIKGDFLYFNGIIKDITERKQAEDSLRLTEQNLRNSIDRSFIGTYILNIDQGTVYVNKAFMDIFGYKNIEEVKTGPPHTHFTTESYAKWALRHEKLMQGIPYPDNYEADIIRKDGAIRHLQVYRQDVFWDGKMRYQVLYHDITERKQAEEALKESESRFHELYENSPIGLYRTTPSGRILMANPALIEMLGYSDFAELSNRNLDSGVFEPSYPRKQFIENIERNGLIQGYEYTWKRKNGTSIQVRENARAIRDASGNILYFDGTVENITERKQAEAALLDSETRYKTLFESAAEGIMIADVATRQQKYVNPAICKLLGYTAEELTGLKVSDIHPPGLRDFAEAEFDAQTRGEKTIVSLPCLRKDGAIIYMDINAVKTVINGRECNVGFFTDVTARKQTEDALKASEEKYSTLVEKSGDGIIILDNRTVTFANQKMEEMTGYQGSELYGKIFTELIAPQYKQILDEGYRTRQAGSVSSPASYELELLTKDGRKIPVDTKANRILLESRYIVMVTIRDITERKQAQAKILASLAEKETILKEVHHRVKNNMQVISSLLRLQEGRVKDKDAAALLKDSQNRIQSMALVYNKLYQSENLASVNMTDYIKELSAGLVKSYAVSPVRVAVNVAQSNVFLNVDSAIPCGMIINELVTNSLKYAFPGNRKGLITISLTENEKGLQLTVGDDGVGIPEGVSLANNSTLGIKLVSNLVRDQLGGTLEIDRRHGTSYQISFPRNKEEK